MKRLIPLLALLLVASCSNDAAPLPTSKKAETFPAPIIELRGRGAEIGAAHGERLGEPIRMLFHAYFDHYFDNEVQRNLAMTAAGGFESQIDRSHLDEISALGVKSGIQPREALLVQCFLDLSPMTACSTITLPADASPDGVARFGRNLDFPSFDIADKHSAVFVIHPSGKFSFASIGWPGMIGVLSGMNEHGLALANMEVDRGPGLPKAMPYTLLYRTILEQCKTVDEAIALLQKTPRQTANNLMLMDASGDRAVAEISPATVAVRRGPIHAALISTNHLRGIDVDSAGRCARYDYLHDESRRQFGNISTAAIQDMLQHVAQGKMTLQSMIFEPSNRVVYLAVGANAPQHALVKLDLKPYFK